MGRPNWTLDITLSIPGMSPEYRVRNPNYAWPETYNKEQNIKNQSQPCGGRGLM